MPNGFFFQKHTDYRKENEIPYAVKAYGLIVWLPENPETKQINMKMSFAFNAIADKKYSVLFAYELIAIDKFSISPLVQTQFQPLRVHHSSHSAVPIYIDVNQMKKEEEQRLLVDFFLFFSFLSSFWLLRLVTVIIARVTCFETCTLYTNQPSAVARTRIVAIAFIHPIENMSRHISRRWQIPPTQSVYACLCFHWFLNALFFPLFISFRFLVVRSFVCWTLFVCFIYSVGSRIHFSWGSAWLLWKQFSLVANQLGSTISRLST